jgi:hypothetical protein
MKSSKKRRCIGILCGAVAVLILSAVLNSCCNNTVAPIESIPDNYIEFELNGDGFSNVKVAQTVASPKVDASADALRSASRPPLPFGFSAITDSIPLINQLATTVQGFGVIATPMGDSIAIIISAADRTQGAFERRTFPLNFPVITVRSDTALLLRLPAGVLQLGRTRSGSSGFQPYSSAGYSIPATTTISETGTVQISQVGSIGGQIKGTFSGKVFPESATGSAIEITNGKFSFQRVKP